MAHPRARGFIGRATLATAGLLMVGTVSVHAAPGAAPEASLAASGMPMSSDAGSTGHRFGFSSVLTQGAATPPQQQQKVCIAHRTGSGRTHFIEVSPNAVPAHEQHGDTVVGPAPCPRQ